MSHLPRLIHLSDVSQWKDCTFRIATYEIETSNNGFDKTKIYSLAQIVIKDQAVGGRMNVFVFKLSDLQHHIFK